MSYDGMVTRCVTEELKTLLVGGKVDKIYQPERDEVILVIRSMQGNHRLLLSASASNPRVHLTQVSRENPMVPPMLCMLMRKHLQGGRILSVSQFGFDRVIRIDIECRNELGDLCTKSIITEIMGRHSNIILLDETNRIMDCAKHIDFTVSAVRQVLPGLFYENPPEQEKLRPDEYVLLDLLRNLDNQPEDTLLDRFLLSAFIGMSPLLAREIVYRFTEQTKVIKAEIDTAQFLTFVDEFLKNLCQNQFCPTLVLSKDDKKPFAFSCVKLEQYENSSLLETASSMSQVIDAYFEKRAQRERMNQRSAALAKLVHNHIERCEKKLVMHQENLQKSKNREQYKIYGDLIKANLYRMENGSNSLFAENYYSESLETVEIPLKSELTPSQNAQRYYKLYSKAKTTEKYAAEQAEFTKNELYYLETVQDALEKADTPAALTEIRDELAEGGYILTPKTNPKKKQKSKPLSFSSSDGFEILVGRNNKQNDELTIRMAYSTDLWFHTKNIPGSHVIIRTQGGKEIPETTIVEAASLAAFYSKAQNSSKVPVDFTSVKNVKKPNGAKPGMVIYDHYNTLYVEPKSPENL